MPNSISVIAAAQVPEGAPTSCATCPASYSHKIAYGPAVSRRWPAGATACFLDMPLPEVLRFVAEALASASATWW